jgi:uncharacterized coiled-coil DUF342 family protein
LKEILRNRPKLPKRPEKLREELERLELIYETVHQDPRRERRLVEQINELSAYLKEYETYVNAREEINEVKRKLDEIDLSGYINKMDELKKKLDNLRKEEEALKKEAEGLQKIKSDLDQEIAKIIEELRELESNMKELRIRKNEIISRFGIKKSANLSYEQIRRIILNKSALLEKALKKMERGESLTFEEFTILVKNGLI